MPILPPSVFFSLLVLMLFDFWRELREVVASGGRTVQCGQSSFVRYSRTLSGHRIGQCILQCHTNNIWNISELNKQTEINNSLFCLIGCCFFYCRRNLMIWNRLNSLLYSVDFLCKKNGSRGPWVFLYCKLLPLLP